MAKEPAPQPEKTLDRIMQERREKGQALRAAGSDPYRNDIRPSISLADVRARYAATKPAPVDKSGELPARSTAEGGAKVNEKPAPGTPAAPREKKGIQPIDGESVRVGGRVLVLRDKGKVVFAPIRDTTGDLQLFLNIDHLAPDDWTNIASKLDAGDQVVAEGPAFWTNTGELSILTKRLWIVTKSLRPLPDKWHGLSDVEARYRQRYVDLAIDPDVRTVFRKRSQIVRGIRTFLDARRFLEVETPMMHPIIGGAAARPFVTHHNALDMKLFMRIAPELYLKRLVVGGFDRVYEINRNFRNEGLSRQHNPEFTMLEFYQAYATYVDLMDLTEELVSGLARDINGGTKVTWDGVEVELAAPWQRLTIKDAVRTLGGIANADQVFSDPLVAAEVAAANGVPAADIARVLLEGVPHALRSGTPEQTVADFKANPRLAHELVARYPDDMERRIRAGHLGYLLFEATAEAKLVQPTFLTQFPLAVSPLARRNDQDPAFCDRFELFVCGREIANGFSELNDPDDQRSRFQAQVDAKNVGAAETMDYDEDYCRALELGMPPTAGEGIGIDRLTMLLTGQASIRDVILFPLMRAE